MSHISDFRAYGEACLREVRRLRLETRGDKRMVRDRLRLAKREARLAYTGCARMIRCDKERLAS